MIDDGFSELSNANLQKLQQTSNIVSKDAMVPTTWYRWCTDRRRGLTCGYHTVNQLNQALRGVGVS